MQLLETICYYIGQKVEGPNWDFKRRWYSHNNEGKIDLIHDIICFSNNLVDHDCYIIIGVSDETCGCEILGVSDDINRLTTQNITDFISSLKFAGGVHPNVLVEKLEIESKVIDVIVIKNSKNVPYYLEERYKELYPYRIYTRINDTNTPKDKNADIDKIEILWKKRFGIDKTGLQRYECILEDLHNWDISFDKDSNKNYYYKCIRQK